MIRNKAGKVTKDDPDLEYTVKAALVNFICLIHCCRGFSMCLSAQLKHITLYSGHAVEELLTL